MLNHKSQNQQKSQSFSEETLRSIYAAQWRDLHHSREQDWRLFNLLGIGLIGVGGLKVFNQFPELQSVSSIVFAAISLVAIGVTVRHSALFNEKMEAIKEIEKLLGSPDLFKKHKRWMKLFKVQYLLIAIYLLFALFFFYLACTGLDASSTNRHGVRTGRIECATCPQGTCLHTPNHSKKEIEKKSNKNGI